MSSLYINTVILKKAKQKQKTVPCAKEMSQASKQEVRKGKAALTGGKVQISLSLLKICCRIREESISTKRRREMFGLHTVL